MLDKRAQKRDETALFAEVLADEENKFAKSLEPLALKIAANNEQQFNLLRRKKEKG